MHLAFSTNAYKQQGLEAAIADVAAAGYAGVEIMADVPHAWPADMSDNRIEAVNELLERSGLTVSNLNAFTLFALGDTYHPSWIDDDPHARRRRIDHTKRCLARHRMRRIKDEPNGNRTTNIDQL